MIEIKINYFYFYSRSYFSHQILPKKNIRTIILHCAHHITVHAINRNDLLGNDINIPSGRGGLLKHSSTTRRRQSLASIQRRKDSSTSFLYSGSGTSPRSSAPSSARSVSVFALCVRNAEASTMSMASPSMSGDRPARPARWMNVTSDFGMPN